MIVTSFQDFKLREKQISPTFSYFLINNALLYYFLANWLAHNKKMTEKSWNDVTIIPSVLFLVSRFCTPPEMKFDAFGTSKHGKENRYRKFSLLYISVHGGDLIEQIKNKPLLKKYKDSMTEKQNVSRPSLKVTDHSSAIADHVETTGPYIKWDHFDILASGKTDFHCKIEETLFI